MKQRPYVAWISLVALIVAATLRIYQCFDWPLDGDEIYTLHNSRVMQWGVDPEQLTGRIYALCPLSFYLNRPLVDVGVSDEVAIRAVPLLAGIAACGLLGWLCYREFGPLVGLAATVLLVFNPYHVEMSQYGRYYSLVFLLANLALLLLARSVRQSSLLLVFASQVILLAAIASHLPAAFLLPAELVYLLVAWRLAKGDRPQRNFLLRAFALLLLFHGLLLLVLIPAVGLWSVVQQSGARSPLELILGWTAGAGLGVVILNVCGIAYLLHVGDRRVWLPLAAQLVPCTALFGLAVMGKTVMPQFTGYVYFSMFLVCGLALERLCGQFKPAERRVAAVFCAAVFLLLALAPSLPSLASHYVDGNRHDFRTWARKSPAESSSPKGSIVCSSWPHVFAYHARREGKLPVVELGRTAKADDIIAAANDGQLVVLPLEMLGVVAIATRLRDLDTNISAVIKIERDGSIAGDSKGVTQSVLLMMCQKIAEDAPPRYDHRRNRLDIYFVRPPDKKS